MLNTLDSFGGFRVLEALAIIIEFELDRKLIDAVYFIFGLSCQLCSCYDIRARMQASVPSSRT